MRKNMIESDVIEAVIGLGPNLFYNSPMEACILVCNKAKKKDRPKIITRLFGKIEGQSIDYGVMEKAGNIHMIPCENFCWYS